MVRDNHPKFRQAKRLERKKPTRPTHDRILIICEGAKTEPNYFNEIRSKYRIHSAHVGIYNSAYGTNPKQVVEFAKDKFHETREWEKVFCVFDRDDHEYFDDAIRMCEAFDKAFRNDIKQFARFIPIPSIPCFELWLLLHFECATKEIHRNQVYAVLNKHLKGYRKGGVGYFAATCERLPSALENAQRLRDERQRHGRENPFTEIDRLVMTLLDLKGI
ncbi:RloB domain-containing protein [Mariprofundus erugo]|uniref:RloB family protein n=1 Tax=Mariprofundus erugo TaxID=2528639 RepID=UPI0010FD7B32|nr:RloB family protein [Mariprofundus erugo]TLS75293.1 RloB domain-containing protein [Mariprofundus erugo]